MEVNSLAAGAVDLLAEHYGLGTPLTLHRHPFSLVGVCLGILVGLACMALAGIALLAFVNPALFPTLPPLPRQHQTAVFVGCGVIFVLGLVTLVAGARTLRYRRCRA